MCIFKDFAVRYFRHDDPATSVEMNWHENARHPLAGLALIVCDRRLVLVNNGLERIHQAHRYLDARHFLAEVELTDLRRLVRMNDGKSRLIQNDKLSRTVCRQLR